jgi:predicted PurR-regulated permease PerM
MFNISSAAIIKILFFLLLAYFLYRIRAVIGLVFAAWILALALNRWVDWLQKKRLPRGFGVIIIFLLFFLVIGGVVALIVPIALQQINDLITNFPAIYNTISLFLAENELLKSVDLSQQLQASLGKISSLASDAITNIFKTIFTLFGGAVSFVAMLFMAIYFVMQEQQLKQFVRSLSPEKYQNYFVRVIERMQEKLNRWLLGQIILSFIIFILVYLGLTVLGVQYALLLALIAGLLEAIPILGPIISAIPAIFLALLDSPLKALLTLGIYILFQQLESNIIAPRIMSRSVELNPIVIIAAILAGAELGGIVGALLAVPVATVISIPIQDLIEKRFGVDNSAK